MPSTTTSTPQRLLDARGIARAVGRMAHQIVETNEGAINLVAVGIKHRGVPLAHRLAKEIGRLENIVLPVGTLDIGLYRDDLRRGLEQPVVGRSDILFPIAERDVLLVDDVLFTGRTIRAALDAIVELGRPMSIQLAVLVDRGHREFPIQPNYVGLVTPTAYRDRVTVHLVEIDGDDSVTLETR